MSVGVCQAIGSYVVDRIQAVMPVYLSVDVGGDGIEEFRLGYIGIECVQEIVYTRRTMIVDVAFVARDTGLHAHDVVGGRLAEEGIVSFLLKLFSLQEISGVVFIRDGERHDMHG